MSDTRNPPRPDRRALGVGVALLALAGLVLRDAYGQTIAATYGLGPTAMPILVSIVLGALALGHFVVAFRGGLPEAPDGDPVAIGWIALGLGFLIACIGLGGGFIAAATVLFATTARAFGRRAFLMDLAIGLIIGLVIFVTFSKLLTLTLPSGPLERLL
jgi:putative tricarboxylic transport membrane protein